jgi:hypothetical protein
MRGSGRVGPRLSGSGPVGSGLDALVGVVGSGSTVLGSGSTVLGSGTRARAADRGAGLPMRVPRLLGLGPRPLA